MPAGTASWTRLSERILIELGAGIVDVELPQESLDNAITEALQEFQSNSGSATVQAYQFVTTIDNQRFYPIADHVTDIMNISRVGAGIVAGIEGMQYGSFLYQALLNQQSFDLLSFHMTQSFIETLNLLSASDPHYIFHRGLNGGSQNFDSLTTQEMNNVADTTDMQLDNRSRQGGAILELLQTPKNSNDVMMLEVRLVRSDAELINDIETGPWLHYYSRACAKIMLGMAYRKHDGAPGPGGGISLPGNDLIQEGTEEKKELLEDLLNMKYGEQPHGIMFG